MTHCFNLRVLQAAAIAAAAIVGSIALGGKSAEAQDYCGPYSRPDLFYNYYVPPVNCGGYGGVGARVVSLPAADTAAGGRNVHHVPAVDAGRVHVSASPLLLPR